MKRVEPCTPLTVDEIKEQLLWLLPELHLQLFGVTDLGSALAEYRPKVGRVFYVDNLSNKEFVSGVIHELGHVYLHPPNFDSYEEGHPEDNAEEQFVHNVAMVVCAAFGFYEYVDTLRARGVPERLLMPPEPAVQKDVYEAAAWIEAAIRNPEFPPGWPIPSSVRAPS